MSGGEAHRQRLDPGVKWAVTSGTGCRAGPNTKGVLEKYPSGSVR